MYLAGSRLEGYENFEKSLRQRTNVGETGTVLSDVDGLLEIETGYTR